MNKDNLKTKKLAHICRELIQDGNKLSRRDLSMATGMSLGTINYILRKGEEINYFQSNGEHFNVTQTGLNFMEQFKVDNAIILAAGFGLRCVPLTYETPKGLLTVYGKPMLERQIEQLLEKKISEIIIVVGYMKEKFDYLIDKYGVKLLYNPEYSTKNNLTSLYCALPYLKGSYILCADNWIEKNIFNAYEAESWFSCLYMEGNTNEWCVEQTKNERIKKISIGGADAWAIVGPAYFSRIFSEKFAALLREYYSMPGTEDYYWEHVLRENISKLPMYMNKQTDNVHEFEDLSELRRYDDSYINNSNNVIMESIASFFCVPEEKISDIFPIKEGLTNKSFHFCIGENGFVYRFPGIGTEKLINRANEKYVYDAIKPMGISDNVLFFDANTGVKISEYIENARNADPFNDVELRVCMEQIRKVHTNSVKSAHSYDIASMIEYYYSLAEEINAIRFSDVGVVRDNMRQLLKLRQIFNIPEVLCHGDFAHVNVLLLPDNTSRIIDWEFSGMSDPIMDVSMFAIFAQFDRARIDLSLHMYLGRDATKEEFARLYMYVALSGFLWCMWSEYKQRLGQEFGEYPMIMYRYMKDYYDLLKRGNYITIG
ncbi:choline kinase [Synergistales bacterium]|nr:choline kinase [Synergistales bacterium]